MRVRAVEPRKHGASRGSARTLQLVPRVLGTGRCRRLKTLHHVAARARHAKSFPVELLHSSQDYDPASAPTAHVYARCNHPVKACTKCSLDRHCRGPLRASSWRPVSAEEESRCRKGLMRCPSGTGAAAVDLMVWPGDVVLVDTSLAPEAGDVVHVEDPATGDAVLRRITAGMAATIRSVVVERRTPMRWFCGALRS